MEIKLVIGEYDWLATRLTPRKYYPPKPKEYDRDRPLTSADLNPKPPRVICLPGAEGLGVEFGKYKGVRTLIVRLAIATPFTDIPLNLARSNHAVWNDVFNTWDIPILQQDVRNALRRIWELVEDVFFELDMSLMELHWRWDIGNDNLKVLQKRIYQLNHFWESDVVDYDVAEPALVYSGLGKDELEESAVAAFQKAYPKSTWQPQTQDSLNRLVVNYLRHRCSCYHVLLRTDVSYLQVFSTINRAIAVAYPWLKEEALNQIQRKQYVKQNYQ